MREIVVDRIYHNGCWDSNGHEEIRTRRFKCDSLDDALSRYSQLIEMEDTRVVKILGWNRYRNCFEVLAVGHPADDGTVLQPTLPAGLNDRQSVQSVLFRLVGELS